MTIIPPKSGTILEIQKDEQLKIIDLEGQQVVDFWAINTDNSAEFLSVGVTVDCNKKLLISTGDLLFSNLYRPMFEIVEDTVGVHDLIHPCCRQEMYTYFYDEKRNHPNCLANINKGLLGIGKKIENEINPFNIFMNTEIFTDGRIMVREPISNQGDFIVLKPLIKKATVFMASCSVDTGKCNGGKCTSIGYNVY